MGNSNTCKCEPVNEECLLTDGDSDVYNYECSFVGDAPCGWEIMYSNIWCSNRIEIGSVSTVEECGKLIKEDSRCSKSKMQRDRNSNVCKCVPVNEECHLTVGDSDVYNNECSLAGDDCGWELEHSDIWCSNRIEIGSVSTVEECGKLIETDSRCSKSKMQRDRHSNACKCVPVNEECPLTKGDSDVYNYECK